MNWDQVRSGQGRTGLARVGCLHKVLAQDLWSCCWYCCTDCLTLDNYALCLLLLPIVVSPRVSFWDLWSCCVCKWDYITKSDKSYGWKGWMLGIYYFHKVCIRDRMATFMCFWDLECKHLNLVGDIKVVWLLRAKTLKVLISVFIYTQNMLCEFTLWYSVEFLPHEKLVKS